MILIGFLLGIVILTLCLRRRSEGLRSAVLMGYNFLFVAAISSYHKELLGDVLDRSYDNTVSVDVDAQRNYLEGRGTDTSEMDDTAVAEANTGSKVFVTSNVKFVDAMEDLKMTVNM